MLPPMRPKPIMPSCIWPSPVIVAHASACRTASSRVVNPAATCAPRWTRKHTPVALGQHLEVAARLRRLDDTERIFLIRHLQIGGIVAGDLQEHAGVRPALVGLARRMKEPRPEAEASGDALAVADQDADILECVAMLLVAFDIGEERAIIPFSNSLEMRREIFHERAAFTESLAVLLVGKEREAALLRAALFPAAACRSVSYAVVSSRVLSLLASTSG